VASNKADGGQDTCRTEPYRVAEQQGRYWHWSWWGLAKKKTPAVTVSIHIARDKLTD